MGRHRNGNALRIILVHRASLAPSLHPLSLPPDLVISNQASSARPNICSFETVARIYRGEKKGLQHLLSYSQAGAGRKAKQGQEEISRNHVPTFILGSVYVPRSYAHYFRHF